MTDPLTDVVLVVDDTPDTLGFVTEALEADGVNVLVATNGMDALGVVNRITPDVILMDALMPGIDGFETCRRLKKTASAAHVPVIFMTGLSEPEHVVHALDSGGVDFLTKPIHVDELRARIRVHLANARSVQTARVALDASGRHLMAVSSSGTLVWATPQTETILNGAGIDHAVLSADLRGWIPQNAAAAEQGPPGSVSPTIPVAGADDLQILFVGTLGADEYVFRINLQDAPARMQALQGRYGLTQRETEVLAWVSKGKSNKEIGLILELSPRTVNKHLEQIFIKLGVENRAAAAVRAAEILQGF